MDPRVYEAGSFDKLAATFGRVRKTVTFEIVALDDDTILRIFPLRGGLSSCCIAFVDSFSRQTPVLLSSRKFGLRKRESNFLPLLLAGLTNVKMAANLFLAESTVADHIKSSIRKTNAKRRSDAIARICNFGDEDGIMNATSA